MRFGLAENIIEKIIEVLETNPKVDKAYIFGSRAKGNFREASDIDIAVKGTGLNYDDVLQLSVKLEELQIPSKIDLLDFDAIKEALLEEHIERVGIEFYSSWKEFILEDIIEKFIDYRGKTPTKTTSGIPLITAKVVKAGRLIEPNEFIAESDYGKWMTRGFPEINDVILTTEAPLGEVALIKNKHIALAQRIITLQTKKGICNSIFLKYYFQSSEGQFALQSRSSGSTVEGIKSSELKKLIVCLPPLPEQTAIASILSSLDDKIDLLHRQNKTLEQLAETLFRQWFVEEADESWEIGNLGNIASFHNGKSRPTESGEIPIYGGNGILGYTNVSNYKGRSIIIGRVGAYCGSLYLEDKEIWVSDNALLVKAKNEKQVYFLYYLLKTLDLNSMAQGSSHPLLTQTLLKSIEILIPTKSKIGEFDNFVEKCDTKINYNNNKQIQTLTKLRDTLLPKLMSGEVRVKV